MKKINQILVVILLLSSGILNAQCPRLRGFSMVWEFCDQNGNNLSGSRDVCVGDKVYLINKSRYGVNAQGQNGAFTIGSQLVEGKYTFRNPNNNNTIFPEVDAVDWPYNGIISFTANAPYFNSTTGMNPNNNFEVRYFATNSCGATSAPGSPMNLSKTLWYHAHTGPTLTVSASSTTICKGQSTVLNASGGSALTWNTGATGNSTIVSPTSTTTYSVTGENNFGCSSTEEITITVVDAKLSIGRSITSCGTKSICFVGLNNASTQWFLSNGTQSIPVSSGPCISLSQTGNYIVVNTITLPDGNTCSSVQHFSFTNTENQLDPRFDITTTNQGNYYSITADAIQNPFPSGVTGIGYWWKVENLTTGCTFTNYNKWWNNFYPNIANGFTNNFPEYGTGNCQPFPPFNSHGRFEYGHTYRITRGLWSDCDSWTSASAIVSLQQKTKKTARSKSTKEIHYLTEQELKQLKDQFIKSGKWTKNGPINKGFEISSSVITNKVNSSFEVYPNPSNGNFNLQLKDVSDVMIEIIDLTGKKVLEQKILENKTDIDISNQPNGIYLVKLIKANSIEVKRIIKQ